MAKKDKMTDDELLQHIREEVAAADYSGTNELSFQREQSTRSYNGVLTDGLQPTTGMSSIINNKIQPAVETLTTYLTNIFCSDKETVMFSPTSEQLYPAADQMTKIVNHCIHKKNDGYKLINRWIKDAAINKNGIVKITWDEQEVSHKEFFEGTEEEYEVFIYEMEAKGYEHENLETEKSEEVLEITDEVTGETIEVSSVSYKYTCKFTKTMGYPKIENVPPEEFLINEGATDINHDPKTRFVCQRQVMPVSDLLEQYPDVDVEDILASQGEGYLEYEYERLNRHGFDGTYDYTGTDPSQGPMRLVEVTESWIRADRDGDGVAEWRHVISAGYVLLLDEEWFGGIPFASFTFFPIPHKFYGLSVYDKLQWYHRAASMLLRSEIDMRLLQNTYRIIANPNNIDIRDLQSGRPGIIKVRPGVEPSKDIQVLPSPTGASNTQQVLAYLHQELAGQIGIDPNTGQISQDVQKSGNDAEKTSQVVDNASAKIEMYAREFAEVSLKEVVWQVSKLIIEHKDDVGVEMLVSKLTPNTPELLIAQDGMTEYFDRDDITAKVGLGHQTQKQKIQGAQAIIQQQAAMEASPVSPTPIPYQYKQAAATELTKALGFEDTTKFFPSPEEVQAEQQRVQQQQAAALQQQQQMAQAQMQEDATNNESKRSLEAAKAQEATIKAEGAARKQQLDEEAKVVDIENVKQDNQLNVRRQEAQEEQMAANIELQNANQRLQKELAELKAKTDLKKQEMADDKTIRLKREGGSE